MTAEASSGAARPGRRGSGLRRAWPWIVGAVILLALVWLGFHLLKGRKAKPAAPATIPVATAKAVSGDMNVVLQGLGTVTPLATITVQTQINGQLQTVAFKEGQIVKKGQFLAEIDPRPYQIALAQAQGTLARDTGLLEQARSDLARYEILGRQNSIALQQVADQQFLVRQDEGTVMQDQAAVRSAELNLAYCHIVSPITGRTGLRLVDAGNYVQTSSSTGLVVITQLQPITVIFALPETDIQALADQMRSGRSLPVQAYDQNNAKVIAQGELTTLDNTVDTTTGTVKLRASFPNKDFALFPNVFVNAHLTLQTLHNVTEIPVRAVQYGAPGSFVYRLNPNDTVSVQVIKTGVTDGDNIQVVSGLNPGDQVVTDGVSLLRNGAKVRLDSNAKAAASDAGPGAPPGQQPQNRRKSAAKAS